MPWLRSGLRGDPGRNTDVITLKEIAKACGVSPATVSNVINGKAKTSKATSERIMKMVRETGYRPNAVAKGLRTRRTNTIAVIAEDVSQFTSPPMISSIMRHCEQHGLRVVLYNMRLYDRWSDAWYDQDAAYHSILDPILDNIISTGSDGVIYLAGHKRVIHCSPNILLPTVMAYAISDATVIPSVILDDLESARDMVRHLISMGHKRIGFIGGQQDNMHTLERIQGYRSVLEEAGIPYDSALVTYGTWNRESAHKCTEELLTHGVTAIFACNDRMAGGVYDILRERGLRVGSDVSVAGFDDESISKFFSPELTTTALPLYEIGSKAGELMTELLAKPHDELNCVPKETTVIKVPCSLKVRASVGAV